MEQSDYRPVGLAMNLSITSVRLVGAFCVAAVLAGCQTPRQREMTPSDLQLIGSGALVLPEGCSPMGSIVVDFTVRSDGATENIRPSGAPACAQNALTAWVATFRYLPPGVATKASVEWLLVEGKTGS